MKIQVINTDGTTECFVICPCEVDTPEKDLCVDCRLELENDAKYAEYLERLRNGDIETELE